MTKRIPLRISRLWEHEPNRALLWESAPVVLFLALAWAKLALFSLPPWYHPELAWNGWIRPGEMTQSVLGSLASLLLLFAPLLLLPARARLVGAWVMNLLVTLVVLADLVHFRFFGDVLSVASAGEARQVGMVIDSVVELLQPLDAVLFIDLMLAPLLLRRYQRARPAAAPLAPRRRRRTAVFALLTGVLLLVLVPVRIVAMDSDQTFHFGYLRFFGVQKIGLLNYHAYEAGRSLVRSSLAAEKDDAAMRRHALRYAEEWREEATRPTALFGAARGSNVIMVLLESFQSFPLGLKIEGREVTPNLNRLAGRSMYFPNFYSQAWEGMTSDGEFTTLQSLHPLSAGSVATTYPDHSFRGLPQILAEQGYATASFHAYYGDLWNMRRMHPALGFQQSSFQETYREADRIGMGISDGEFYRQTLPRLARLPRPFMAYLMTLTTHHPYELPARYRTLPVGPLEGTVLGRYLQTVHYEDQALGELVEQLKRTGLWEQSTLVLFGDHTAKLGDRADLERLLTRYAGLGPRAPGLDARYWKRENGVTLLVHLPGDSAAGVYPASGGHLDIAPTLLNLLGVRHDMMTLGRDLSGGSDGFVVARNGSFVLGDTLCVVPGPGSPTKQCRTLSGNQELDAGRFAARYDAARERLRVSDVILRNDLIPER